MARKGRSKYNYEFAGDRTRDRKGPRVVGRMMPQVTPDHIYLSKLSLVYRIKLRWLECQTEEVCRI